jgi:5'-deoxynucleotidase YfbR-like HD superfamily hydrolase
MRHQGGYQRKTACGRWQAGGIVDAWEAERVTCPACREASTSLVDTEADVESNDPVPSPPEANASFIESVADSVVELGVAAHRFAAITRSYVNWPDRVTPESDADHTVMLAWMAPALAALLYPELDANLVAMYASVHDAVETFSGDVNTFNATPELLVGKQALEAEALLQWESLFASRLPWLTASIARYEHQEDAESRFTRGVDKLLPIIVHITDDASGLLRAGRTRPEFVAALAETRSRLIGFTPDFPALHQLADSLSVTALRVYDEAEADVMSNTSSNPPLPSGASSPGPAARPYRKFHVYSAGWDGDPETLGMRCWVCGVSQEFGADGDAIGLEELTAWAEAHRCPGLTVTAMTEEAAV